ncbi:MAG: folate-binding protein [Methylococcaceae bacterium]|nr:folate-binding protein [Methylococcaceae bacterium]
MNSNWKNFLLANNAHFSSDTHISFPNTDSDKRLYPIAHLAVLTVSGTEAGQFLQGQITCNVHDVTATQSSLGAMCNPKGRAITTFLLAKSGDDFLLVLPNELLEIVKKRLSMYVLRSKVTLTDSSDSLCLLGLTATSNEAFLATHSEDNGVRINMGNRCLIIADVDNAMTLWSEYTAQGFQATDSMQWQTLDILSGIPWLTTATSEEFIPQMLNLDKLGGISLTKGCYTGQEIVARTHYLGKAKRGLFIAECQTANPEPNASIIDADGQVIGNVLLAQNDKLLIVLQLADTDTAQLQLKDYNQAPLTLLTVEPS